MSIAFACPHCSAPYNVPEQHAGKRTKCKDCGGVMQVPELDTEAGEAEASPPSRRERKTGRERTPARERTSRRQRGRRSAEPEEPAVPPAAIGIAVAAGALGLALWLAIAAKANLEIGYIAVGIGLAVGAGMVKGGGRGSVAAVVAAAITAFAIVGGHVGAVMVGRDQVIDLALTHRDVKAAYQEVREVGKLVKDLDHPITNKVALAFGRELELEWEGGDTPNPTELISFVQEMKDAEKVAGDDGWEVFKEQRREIIKAEWTLGSALPESVGPKSLVFLVIGIGAAFGLVAKNS